MTDNLKIQDMKAEEILSHEANIDPVLPETDYKAAYIEHNVCLKAMEEYAKQEAIGFAEWISDNGYILTNDGKKWVWALDFKCKETFSTEQLYEQYKGGEK